jgi:hypothetical protein
MPHSAFYIVEEFLRSRDAQARKNALTALAVLDRDEDTIERLAKVALNDADDGVRRRAVEEIVSLSDEALPRAVKVLQDTMADPSRRQTAYALLGHIKSLGRALPKASSFLSLPARLRLAWAMNKYTYPVRNWPFRFRTWKPALIGATLSYIVVLLSFYKISNWETDSYYGMSFSIATLAVTVCAFAIRHTTPFNLYFDRHAAFIVEIAGAMLYSIAAYLMLLLFVVPISKQWGDTGFLVLLIGLPLMIGFTRAATLLSYGVVKHRWTNIAFQGAVSAASIFLLLAAVNFILWKIYPVVGEQQEKTFKLEPAYQVMESFWVLLLPIGVAAALSFAMIDNKSPFRHTVAGRLSKYLSYTTILLYVILLTFILGLGRRGSPYRGVNINATFDRLSGRVPSLKKPAQGLSAVPVLKP